MKIQIISDLHLEFGHKPDLKNAGADVLVLAGDIGTAKNFPVEFFERMAKEFKDVVYIMGNHEHYNYLYNDTATDIRNNLAGLQNVHFLDKQTVTIDGVKFVGTTLWTDLNKDDPLTKNRLLGYMNDYRIVKYRDSKGHYFKLPPQVTYREHLDSRAYIESETVDGDQNIPCVVVTHHAPSYESIHPRYKSDKEVNGGYASDLTHMARDNIKLWFHGHTHSNFDYMMGPTRVVCNPHGYPGERVMPDPILDYIVEI